MKENASDNLIKAPDAPMVEGMKAKVAELTKTSVSAELICKEECSYGQYYDIERKISSEWFSLPITENNIIYEDILYVQRAGKTKNMNYSFFPYGELSPGEYRVVTEVNGERSVLFEFLVE